MSDKIKVLVVDDFEVHTRRISKLLEQQADMEVVGIAHNGYEAVLLAERLMPDIILMDIEMESNMSGIFAAKEINRRIQSIKIIILTAHADDEIVFASFQTGIVDYLLKDAEDKIICEAIRSAYHNCSPIRPIIAEKIRKEFIRSKEKEQQLVYVLKLISDLTTSEFEILRCIAKGKSQKEIASMRFVEVTTIKKQVSSILKKCEQKNTKQLIETIKSFGILEILEKL